MRTDGRFARCPLKGTLSDALFALLCGYGHNLRKLLASLIRFQARAYSGSTRSQAVAC